MRPADPKVLLQHITANKPRLIARLKELVQQESPSENPAAIRAEIMTGATGLSEVGDRREAIRAAAALLSDGDILVVAGKGHEQGQTVGDVVHPFDDVTETAQALREGALHG